MSGHHATAHTSADRRLLDANVLIHKRSADRELSILKAREDEKYSISSW